jgi:hypothetical protein
MDLQWMYRHVVVKDLMPAAGEPCLILAVLPKASPAQCAGDAAEQVDALFEQHPGLSSVTVYAAAALIGSATREESMGTDAHVEGTAPYPHYRDSGGDRTILPGQSQRYEVLRFYCHRCDRSLYTVAPAAPKCPLSGLDSDAAS